ncbi:HesA/MoeB/ThiF family protein [Marinifilum caeruleilacunae]|uniref:HesA/MoeB/ThiF family protein n=1 Tax=Marinifilum caeruleilacunae TaxID=2499076 RepID=A0ABX1WRF4_9BACT|nr:HesA/MoeB/ThiF family protein [Marinifilum caeruleilacunae]NOU58679.1 HesA/MoeB/ThiF family protein [Marinifilum caeruleilacunae]
MKEIQKERYNRHIILSEIGEEGQKKLLNAKVLVVGAGGLGAPVLQYLVAAGVGYIGIVDADTVSLSNLQRQILYRENQIGKSKVEHAKQSLTQLNSDVKISTYSFMLDDSNAEEIISAYDVIVGATDNFDSRKCIDRISKQQGKAFVHGSIGEFEGQISVLNHKGGPSYFDLFPDTPDESALPLGVLGVLPGIIGSMQACEAIKIILEIGDILSGKLLIYDALSHQVNIINFS